MRDLLITLILLLSMNVNAKENIYNISINDIDGNIIELSSFKGKYILFVNVASKCGFTKQYADLEKLYQRYKDDLVVIAYWCNVRWILRIYEMVCG